MHETEDPENEERMGCILEAIGCALEASLQKELPTSRLNWPLAWHLISFVPQLLQLRVRTPKAA
jgi:hypothetical protein